MILCSRGREVVAIPKVLGTDSIRRHRRELDGIPQARAAIRDIPGREADGAIIPSEEGAVATALAPEEEA